MKKYTNHTLFNELKYYAMRWDIINYLIEQNKYSDYLEIGVQDYYSCCDKIVAKNKTSVDPFPRNLCTHVMTSDEFFSELSSDTMYDIIFIDGLHEHKQVILDIENSLLHLREKGTIVVHDCLPANEDMQSEKDNRREWTGDVWKAIAILRTINPNITINTVNHDYGCAIIQKGNQNLISINEDNLNWKGYEQNYRTWMNIISIDEFYKAYGKV
jgi:hypothetical protein